VRTLRRYRSQSWRSFREAIREGCLQFYDKDDKLYRVIESKKVEMVQKFPTVIKSVVSDLKTGSKTEMEFSNVKYDINLKDVFQERYLRRPPREAIR
jgi:hypothetical protein